MNGCDFSNLIQNFHLNMPRSETLDQLIIFVYWMEYKVGYTTTDTIAKVVYINLVDLLRGVIHVAQSNNKIIVRGDQYWATGETAKHSSIER